MTLEQLKQIREEAAKNISMREHKEGYRVIVGMGTVGIAAGAKAVLNKFVEEVQLLGLYDVVVTQNGYLEETGFEPVVVIRDPQGNEKTYGKVSVEDVTKLVKQNVVNGQEVSELLLENLNK